MAEDEQFDVAISFLSKDDSTAQSLADMLSPLKLFCYSRNQEDVAGTDGMESFRAAFRDQSRMQVVLYREAWGQTPWTKIEQTAIQERCLAEGWRGLFFVMLEDAKRPKWVPDNEIHFDLTTFPMEQLAGAIRARAKELGAEIRPETPIERARRAKARADFEVETRELFRRAEGVNLAREEAGVVCARLEKELGAAGKELGVEYRAVRVLPFNIGWTTSNAGLMASFRSSVNMLDRDAAFEVQLFKHDIVLPGENSHYSSPGMPKRHCHDKYKVSRLMQMGMCWEIHSGTFLSSNALADKIIDDYWSAYEESITKPIDWDQ